MSASTSGQAEPPAGPEAGATPRGDSTSGQAAGLAGRLRRHVATLEGVRHPRAAPERHRAARDYVAAELGALGLTVALAPFTFRGRTHHNVVATRAGRDARRPRLLVGAHFDSTADPPGADDNASGVAAMIECARLVATRAAPPEGGLEFVGFDLEEQQTTTYRVGSRRLARRCRAGGEALAGALILEMVGYRDPTPGAQIVPPFLGIDVPRTGDFVAAVGDTGCRTLLRGLVAASPWCSPRPHSRSVRWVRSGSRGSRARSIATQGSSTAIRGHSRSSSSGPATRNGRATARRRSPCTGSWSPSERGRHETADADSRWRRTSPRPGRGSAG